MNRRIVITGIGVISPIGIGKEPFWEGLASGRCGISRIEAFDVSNCRTRIAGEVKDFSPKDFVKPRKALKVMARDIQMAVAAAAMAVEDSRVKEAVVPERMGVSLGAGLISSDVNELGMAVAHARDDSGAFDIRKFGAEGMEYLFPLWLLKYLPNMLACHMSIIHDARGPSNTITTACAASTQAIGEGCRIIERGDADVMVCGGAESKLNAVSLVRYILFGGLSERNEEPERACRPFDRDRDGAVLGEGGGLLVIEDLEHARKRGATIYAEIAGYGTTCDASAASSRERVDRARAECMRRALADGGLSAGDLDLICACGLGSRENDRLEAEAIQDLLGEGASRVPVTSIKSMIGHLGAGAGGVEMIACVLAIRHGLIPPTLNCDNPDEGFHLDFVAQGPRRADIHAALCTASNFAGQNAAIAVRRFVE
ncbi:MAG: beta-ketoacyl-[acyl-carrier-protein] synthase family protein [Planctomycetes bacterium]|nr:beta-ketoacyl-[acyl-carrier-protein] synthase family protein [Planctomycetota bacterium]